MNFIFNFEYAKLLCTSIYFSIRDFKGRVVFGMQQRKLMQQFSSTILV